MKVSLVELLLLVTVSVANTPEGSEVLLSKDHLKFGEGTSGGRLAG